jgi:hypothetical protein
MEFRLSRSLFTNFSFTRWNFGNHRAFSQNFLSHDGILAITEPFHKLFFHRMEVQLSRSFFTNFSFTWWNFGYHGASLIFSRILFHNGIHKTHNLGEDSFHIYYKEYLHRIHLVKNLTSWFRAPFARTRVRPSLIKCEKVKYFLFPRPFIDPWFGLFYIFTKFRLAKRNAEKINLTTFVILKGSTFLAVSIPRMRQLFASLI